MCHFTLNYLYIFLSGRDNAVSPSGIWDLPEEPGWRPAHCLHQVQEARDHPHRVQCGAGQGAQVSALCIPRQTSPAMAFNLMSACTPKLSQSAMWSRSGCSGQCTMYTQADITSKGFQLDVRLHTLAFPKCNEIFKGIQVRNHHQWDHGVDLKASLDDDQY